MSATPTKIMKFQLPLSQKLMTTFSAHKQEVCFILPKNVLAQEVSGS